MKDTRRTVCLPLSFDVDKVVPRPDHMEAADEYLERECAEHDSAGRPDLALG